MEPNKILNSDILDLVFENRNKAYGAYELRKTYNKRIFSALGITMGVALLIFLSSFLAKSFESEAEEIVVRDVVLEDIKQEEEKKPEPPPPPPPPKVEPPKVEMTKFTPPVIKKDEEVKQDEIPPEVEKLEDTKIDVVNQEGIKDLGVATPPVVDQGKQVVEAPKQEDENQVFTKVEIEASYAGDWTKFLQRTLNAEAPVNNGAPAGQYTVIVQFIVDKEGNISDVTALTKHGYGMEEEAIRAIKKANKWNPAVQNGRQVKAYRKQPITFVVSEE